jgi:hypothetical protein
MLVLGSLLGEHAAPGKSAATEAAVWFPVCTAMCTAMWFPVCTAVCTAVWFPVCTDAAAVFCAGIFNGASFVFFSFIGFDCVSTLAEEVSRCTCPLVAVPSCVVSTGMGQVEQWHNAPRV